MKNFLILLTISSKDLKLEVNSDEIFELLEDKNFWLIWCLLNDLILATCASRGQDRYDCFVSVGFLKVGMSFLL